jgi:hypothetical protein
LVLEQQGTLPLVLQLHFDVKFEVLHQVDVNALLSRKMSSHKKWGSVSVTSWKENLTYTRTV